MTDDLTGLDDLLDRAVRPPRQALDPVAVRERVDRHRRRQHVLVVLAVLALLLPVGLGVLAGLISDEQAPVLLDDVPRTVTSPTVAPAEDERTAPVGAEGLDVLLDVTVEGTLAGLVEVQPLSGQGPVEFGGAQIGHGLYADAELLVTTRADEVDLGTPGPMGSWLASGDDLRVLVGPPQEVQVVAGGPQGAEGMVVEEGRVLPWLPLTLSVTVESLAPLEDTRPRTVRVPLGDSALRIDVQVVPSGGPGARTLRPVPAEGLELEVPPVGTARSVLLEDGTPIWIANSDFAGVTVVDGRSPFRPNGMVQLARWCPTAQGFYEVYGGSRFLPDGSYAFGPAPGGLATYEVQPAGEGVVRIGAAVHGAARPPAPVQDAEAEVLPAGVAGPWCDEDQAVGGPGFGEHSPDLDAIPTTPLDQVGSVDGRHRVEGRLLLDGRGIGWLCTRLADAEDCSASGVLVDLSAWAGTGGNQPEEQSAYDATVIADVQEGTVVEAWMDAYIPPTPVGDVEPQLQLTRILDVRVLSDSPDGRTAATECAAVLPEQTDCAAIIDTEQLEVIGPDGPIAPDHLGEVQDRGQLPTGWVVVDRHFGDGQAGGNLAVSDLQLPDGTLVADLPRYVLVLLSSEGTSLMSTVVVEAD